MSRIHLYFVALFLGLHATHDSQAQLTLQRHIPMTNGDVHATAISGDTLFFGGEFSKVSLPLTYGTILSASNGAPDLQADRPNFTAHDCAGDGSNGWYVGGAFTAFGNNAFSRLAHIRSDGSTRNWTPDLGSVGDIWSVTTHDNWVFFAGTNNISGADTTTGTNIGWNVTTNGIVHDMAAHDGVLYVGGIFTQCNGQPRTKVAAIDIATGNVTNWNVSCNNDVLALHHTDDGLLIGGKFTTLSGTIRNHVGMLDRSSGLAMPFDPDATGNYVSSLDHANDTVYIGGDFTALDGQPRDALGAALLPSGTVLNWAPALVGMVEGLAVFQDQVIAAVNTFAPGVGVRSYDRSSGLPTAGWIAPTATAMESMALSEGRVYIAGDHTGMGVVNRTALAACRLSTGEILPWAPVLQNAPPIKVGAMEVADGKLFIGGRFVNVDGTARSNLAAFDLGSGALDAWGPVVNSEVMELEVYGGRLYAGGMFGNIDGMQRGFLASFERSDLSLTGWNPNPLTPFNDFTFHGDKVFFGTQGPVLPAIDTLTGIASTWATLPTTPQVHVTALTERFGTIYFGGEDIDAVNGTAREQAAAANATTGQLTPWDAMIDPNLLTEVSAVASNNHTVYLGGLRPVGTLSSTFTIGGTPQGSLLPLDLNTGALPSWHTALTFGRIFSLEASDTLLFVGGDFDELEMQPRPGLAVYRISDFSTGQAERGIFKSDLRIWPSLYEDGMLSIQVPEDVDASAARVELFDQMGRSIPISILSRQLGVVQVTLSDGTADGIYVVQVTLGDQAYRGRLSVVR